MTTRSSPGAQAVARCRPWLEIRPETVVANARAIAARVAPARLCAVVKSNAYGHGLVPVARALQAGGIPELRLAVFHAAEAVALRDAAVDSPLLVLGPVDDEEAAECARRGIELAVLAGEDPRRLGAVRRAAGDAALRVHVKVDTGLNRFGIERERMADALAACDEHGLQVAGVYSHLANAEELDERFVALQAERLAAAPAPAGALRHLAASAAAILYPQSRFDMVRCGIALYGGWPSREVLGALDDDTFDLQPALRWFAPVAQVRDVAAGEPVGYGCEYRPKHDARIAVLPIGYADGLPRAAGGGRTQVQLRGGWAPIVGRICMNAAMVDVTELEDEPVVGDSARLDVENIARAAGTINYEILARLPVELRRDFV